MFKGAKTKKNLLKKNIHLPWTRAERKRPKMRTKEPPRQLFQTLRKREKAMVTNHHRTAILLTPPPHTFDINILFQSQAHSTNLYKITITKPIKISGEFP
jgi:hypothetical protein